MNEFEKKLLAQHRRHLYFDVAWGIVAFLQFGAVMLKFKYAYDIAIMVCVGWVLSRMISVAVDAYIALRAITNKT